MIYKKNPKLFLTVLVLALIVTGLAFLVGNQNFNFPTRAANFTDDRSKQVLTAAETAGTYSIDPWHTNVGFRSIYQSREALQRRGPAIVLLGKYDGVSNQLEPPSSMTYLFVRLKAGESWSYQPPSDHTVCWVALSTGNLDVPERVEARELVVFESSNHAIDFYAEADTEFVLFSAAGHPYELALGKYSVHTSPASLQAGERRIAEIGSQLQKQGRF